MSQVTDEAAKHFSAERRREKSFKLSFLSNTDVIKSGGKPSSNKHFKLVKIKNESELDASPTIGTKRRQDIDTTLQSIGRFTFDGTDPQSLRLFGEAIKDKKSLI